MELIITLCLILIAIAMLLSKPIHIKIEHIQTFEEAKAVDVDPEPTAPPMDTEVIKDIARAAQEAIAEVMFDEE